MCLVNTAESAYFFCHGNDSAINRIFLSFNSYFSFWTGEKCTSGLASGFFVSNLKKW